MDEQEEDGDVTEQGWSLRYIRMIFYGVIGFLVLVLLTVPMHQLCSWDLLRMFTTVDTMCFNHGAWKGSSTKPQQPTHHGLSQHLSLHIGHRPTPNAQHPTRSTHCPTVPPYHCTTTSPLATSQPQEAKRLGMIGAHWLARNRTDRAKPVWNRMEEQGMILSVDQRPRYGIPRLKSRPFWEVDQLSEGQQNAVKILEKNWKVGS